MLFYAEKNEISHKGCWKFLERSSGTDGRETEFTVFYLFIPGLYELYIHHLGVCGAHAHVQEMDHY